MDEERERRYPRDLLRELDDKFGPVPPERLEWAYRIIDRLLERRLPAGMSEAEQVALYEQLARDTDYHCEYHQALKDVGRSAIEDGLLEPRFSLTQLLHSTVAHQPKRRTPF